MSVTFYPELGPVDHYTVECINCDATQNFSTHEAAYTLHAAIREGTAHIDGCTQEPYRCQDGGIMYEVEALGVTPTVNVASSHAVDILEVLGLTSRHEPIETDGHTALNIPGDDLCGSLPAQDFLGRILMALAVAPESAERPAYAAVGASHVTSCYRRAGYLQSKLHELHEVAQFCHTHDRPIIWA